MPKCCEGEDAQKLMGRCSDLILENQHITDLLATLWNALHSIERGLCLEGCLGRPCSCDARRARQVVKETRAQELAFQERKRGR